MFFFASCGEKEPTDDGKDPGKTEEQIEVERKLATVPQKTLALYMKSSGTLCPPCGAWGWNVNTGVMEKAIDYAALFSIHSANFVSKDFITPEGNAIDGSVGINSWPSFIVNSGIGGKLTKIGAGATEAEYINSILSDIDAVSAQTAIAGAAVKWSVSNNVITVNSRVRFFEDTEGSYFVSIWIDEDGPVAPQSGYTGGIPGHHHVLRTATDNHATFGVPLNAEGSSIMKDQLFENTHTTEFPEGMWKKENCTVTAIIWSKTGNLTATYNVINASRTAFVD